MLPTGCGVQKAGAPLVTAYLPQNKREALETICAAVREFTEHGDTPVELDWVREPEEIIAACDAVFPGRPESGGGAVRLQVASLLAVGRVRTADEYRAFWE